MIITIYGHMGYTRSRDAPHPLGRGCQLHNQPRVKADQQRVPAGMVTEPEEPGLSARAWTSNGRYGLSMSRSI